MQNPEAPNPKRLAAFALGFLAGWAFKPGKFGWHFVYWLLMAEIWWKSRTHLATWNCGVRGAFTIAVVTVIFLTAMAMAYIYDTSRLSDVGSRHPSHES